MTSKLDDSRQMAARATKKKN